MKNLRNIKASRMNSGIVAMLACLMVFGAFQSVHAQLNPFQATYFQNRYLSNPAMAGYEKGLNINLGYRQQWSSFEGAPKTQTLTADYAASDKVALGININSDQAGFIRQNRIMGTYAYHLPLNGLNKKLSFGLSLGINDPYIDVTKVNGDQSDIQVANYNQLKAYVDGDFGIAYTSDHLILEGAIPNLKAAFFSNEDTRIDVDRSIFMLAASYQINTLKEQGGLTMEPKVVFRNVKGYDDIVDAGFNFIMNKLGLSFSGMYRTSKSAALGLGLTQDAFDINIGYNIETGAIRTYSAGNFEFGLKLKLFRKK